MRSPKVYAVVTAAAAAIVGMTAWTWADTPTGGQPRPNGSRVTEPLRAEHRELLPHIEELAAAADAIGTAPSAEQRRKVDESYTFLMTRLIPHAMAEDEVLYAKVDSLIGTRGTTRATDTMRRDHTEVGNLTRTLGSLRDQLRKGTLSPAQQKQLRHVLCALDTIVALHFAKEEEVYLPLLDRELTAAEAKQLFERMEEIAQRVVSSASKP